jgi:hypothetical protein
VVTEVLLAGMNEAQLATGVMSSVLAASSSWIGGGCGLGRAGLALEGETGPVEGLDEAAAEVVSGLGRTFL